VDERHEHAVMDVPEESHSADEIRKEIRVYLTVFACLALLTGVTVWGCFGLKLPLHRAIILALVIASVKGSLVAAFFMHLLSEKKLIYGVLLLTAFFFALLLWLPVHDVLDTFGY
jgi:cytochrome c oxidase subunit 4